MRSRIYCLILILTVTVSMRSVQPVSADGSCNTSVNYTNPPDSFHISASKTYPERPVVKQQLEELAARGDLSKSPEDYDSIFTATVSLEPVTATWNYFYTTREWEYDYFSCTTKKCPGEWVDIPH